MDNGGGLVFSAPFIPRTLVGNLNAAENGGILYTGGYDTGHQVMCLESGHTNQYKSTFT